MKQKLWMLPLLCPWWEQGWTFQWWDRGDGKLETQEEASISIQIKHLATSQSLMCWSLEYFSLRSHRRGWCPPTTSVAVHFHPVPLQDLVIPIVTILISIYPSFHHNSFLHPRAIVFGTTPVWPKTDFLLKWGLMFLKPILCKDYFPSFITQL